MSEQRATPQSPSPKQMRYLRDLAMRCGESFQTPRTKAEASAEIKRLRGRTRTSAAERRAESSAIAEALATPADAARVRPEEIEGYGSSATWR